MSKARAGDQFLRIENKPAQLGFLENARLNSASQGQKWNVMHRRKLNIQDQVMTSFDGAAFDSEPDEHPLL